MPKVDLELVKRVMQRNDIDMKQIAQIIEDITVENNSAVDEPEKLPPVKKQFVIMLSDPHDQLVDAGDITGWVLQIPEEDSPYTAEERLHRGVYEFNASPKGRRMPVKSIGEACECVGAKFFKEEKIWVKTKEPILAVRCNNKIPMETKDSY